jgi:hypothetical protein
VATLPAQPVAAAPALIEVGGAAITVAAAKVSDGAAVIFTSRQGNADVLIEWDAERPLAGIQGTAGEVVSTGPGRAVIRLTPDSKWTLTLRTGAVGGDDLHVTVQAGGSEERRTVHLPG